MMQRLQTGGTRSALGRAAVLAFTCCVCIVAMPALAPAEEDHSRGVRILDNPAPTAPAPSNPAAPPLMTPAPSATSLPPTLSTPAPSLTSPPAPTLTSPAPTLTSPPAPTLSSPAAPPAALSMPASTASAPPPALNTGVPDLTAPPTIVTAPPMTLPAPAASLASTSPQVAPPPRTELPVGRVPAENSAGLALDILPGKELQIGQKITLQVATKRAGYLVIVDIDASGKVTQLYPNVRSLMVTPRDKNSANLIQPGRAIRIPNPLNLFAGFELVASPPAGVAMVLAMLSDRPVQVVDLPDVPTDMAGRMEAFSFLQDVARKLRIAAIGGSSELQPARWSFDAKFYVIR